MSNKILYHFSSIQFYAKKFRKKTVMEIQQLQEFNGNNCAPNIVVLVQKGHFPWSFVKYVLLYKIVHRFIKIIYVDRRGIGVEFSNHKVDYAYKVQSPHAL